MRTILYLALIILMTADYVAAQPVARPTTQPQSVLVLPFAPPAGDDYQWVGQSIQQVLAADLTHGSTLKVIAPAGAKPATDADAALKSAVDAGADIVVFGQTQLLDKEIRLTGEVLDVASGQSITGLKATGPIDQLFHLEDAVAGQSLSSLPGGMRDDEWRDRTGYASEPQPNAASDGIYDQGGAPDDNNNYYNYPSYGYAYPAYSSGYYYPYGFYGSGFIVINNGHFHDHDDHFHGDYHNNGFHGNGFHGNGFTNNGGGFSHSSMFNSGFSGGGGGMTPSPRAAGGGFGGGGFRGGGGFAGGGGFHGGMGGGMGGHR